MEYALLRCVRAALLDARSISKLLLRDAHVRSASRNVLRTHVIVNPSVKLVPRDARCVRDACAQRLAQLRVLVHHGLHLRVHAKREPARARGQNAVLHGEL